MRQKKLTPAEQIANPIKDGPVEIPRFGPGVPLCRLDIAERKILEAAWDRLGHALDPRQSGYYVCNFIPADRWEALASALFKETP